MSNNNKIRLQIVVKEDDYYCYKNELDNYKKDGKNAAKLFSDMLEAHHEKQYPGEADGGLDI